MSRASELIVSLALLAAWASVAVGFAMDDGRLPALLDDTGATCNVVAVDRAGEDWERITFDLRCLRERYPDARFEVIE